MAALARPRARLEDRLERVASGALRVEPAPYLRWRAEWELGVEFMDADHRALAALLDALARRYGAWEGLVGGRPVPDDTSGPETSLLADLAALADHTRAHFEREEEAMQREGFPDLPDHKSEHDLLLAELRVLMREIESSADQRIDTDTLDSLKDWLLGHVLEMDRELAGFLNRGAAGD
jgi:hemerythrin-like metal-binding protein